MSQNQDSTPVLKNLVDVEVKEKKFLVGSELMKKATRSGLVYTDWQSVCDQLIERNVKLVESAADFETKYKDMKSQYEDVFDKLKESLDESLRLKEELERIYDDLEGQNVKVFLVKLKETEIENSILRKRNADLDELAESYKQIAREKTDESKEV